MNQSYLEVNAEKAADITYKNRENSGNHSGLFSMCGEILYPVLDCMDFLISLNKKNKFFLRCMEPMLEEKRIDIEFEEITREEVSRKILHGELKKMFYLTNERILSPIASVERFVKLIHEEKKFYKQVVKAPKRHL